jgi:hypothetical protein
MNATDIIHTYHFATVKLIDVYGPHEITVFLKNFCLSYVTVFSTKTSCIILVNYFLPVI